MDTGSGSANVERSKFYKHRGHLDTSNRSAKLDEVSNTGGVILDTGQGSANVKQNKTFTHRNHRGHEPGVNQCGKKSVLCSEGILDTGLERDGQSWTK